MPHLPFFFIKIRPPGAIPLVWFLTYKSWWVGGGWVLNPGIRPPPRMDDESTLGKKSATTKKETSEIECRRQAKAREEEWKKINRKFASTSNTTTNTTQALPLCTDGTCKCILQLWLHVARYRNRKKCKCIHMVPSKYFKSMGGRILHKVEIKAFFLSLNRRILDYNITK